MSASFKELQMINTDIVTQLTPVKTKLTDREEKVLSHLLTEYQYKLLSAVANNPGITTGQLPPNATQAINQRINPKIDKFGLVINCFVPVGGRSKYHNWYLERIVDVKYFDTSKAATNDMVFL